MGRPSRYSPEVRERAVRMVLEHAREHDSQCTAIRSIAAKIGCSSETLRHWAVDRDTGRRPGLTTEERQYCPNGTDLSRQSRDELEAVASALNSRPRKTLGWKTPAEALDDYLHLLRESRCDDPLNLVSTSRFATPNVSPRPGSSPPWTVTATRMTTPGIDAPICQDKRLGCLRDVSAHAEVCHNTLVDFTGEEAFEAADDLASGPAASRPAGDVVDRRLVEPHADDDRAMEGGVRLSVPAPIETMPAGRHPGRSRDRTGTAQLRKGGF